MAVVASKAEKGYDVKDCSSLPRAHRQRWQASIPFPFPPDTIYDTISAGDCPRPFRMAMDNFSYADSVRAALAACLPCFSPSHSEPPSSAAHSEPNARSSSSNDLEHLLRDADSDALSLHTNPGSTRHRKARHRRRPKFSVTLFGFTLFGRPPIYLSDDDDEPGSAGRARALVTASSSTLDSDAAPLDASTIERLTSPDHLAALAAQRERERQQLGAEEEARRKAERRARRRERKARAAALMSLGGTAVPDDDAFEGFQGSGDGMASTLFSMDQADEEGPHLKRLDDVDDVHSGDADDADLGGELYAWKKKPLGPSGSNSDSRSRTSASISVGSASHPPLYQSIPYPHTEMRLPAPMKKKSHRESKRTSTISSETSQSTSTAPYTPVESIVASPAVAAFPVPQERFVRDSGPADFPSVGLSGARRPKPLDPRQFLAHQA